MVRARRNPADGRNGNGGPRQGTPGASYTNRADLRTQKTVVAPGQAYGEAAAQQRALQAVPLAAGPAVPPPSPPGPAANPAEPPPPPDLYRPTERPDEPVTHGLPVGAGAGPEALRVVGNPNPTMTDPIAIQLRALYQRYPSQELADLLTDLR